MATASVFAMNLGQQKSKVEPQLPSQLSSSKDSTQSFIIAPPKSWAGSASTGSTDLTDSQISITIFGYNITSKSGIMMYKFLSIIVPLIPTFFLIIYNAVQLEGIVARSNLLDSMFVKQIDANKLTILASKLQDERYNVIFTILMNAYVPSRDLSEELEVNYAETDVAINKLSPWRDDIPVKVFASRIRFQIRLDDMRDQVKMNQTNIGNFSFGVLLVLAAQSRGSSIFGEFVYLFNFTGKFSSVITFQFSLNLFILGTFTFPEKFRVFNNWNSKLSDEFKEKCSMKSLH